MGQIHAPKGANKKKTIVGRGASRRVAPAVGGVMMDRIPAPVVVFVSASKVADAFVQTCCP